MTMGPTIRKSAATFGLYFACIALCYPVLAQERKGVIQEFKFETPKGELGGNANFSCSLTSVSQDNATVQFLFGGKPIAKKRMKPTKDTKPTGKNDGDGNKVMLTTVNVTLSNVTYDDEGAYTCVANIGGDTVNDTKNLDLRFKGRLLDKTPGPLKPSLNKNTDRVTMNIYCTFEVYEKSPNVTPTVRWLQRVGTKEVEMLNEPTTVRVGPRQTNSTYSLSITAEDSGFYICEINDTVTNNKISGEIEVSVLAPPSIVSLNVTAVNTTELYVSWIVHNYNSPIDSYLLYTQKNVSEGWVSYGEKVDRGNNSFLMKNLKESTSYQVRLDVKTEGWNMTSKVSENWTKTLDEEPVFVPNISIKGFSATSVTIGWPPPRKDIAHLIHYYILEGWKKDAEEDPMKACHPRDENNLPFMFGNLDPHSTYLFQVRACSEYTQRCGNRSDIMEAATLDGIPGKPGSVSISCNLDAGTHRGFMNLTWEPPSKPNAEIKGYFMELTGSANYKDRYGTWKTDTWGPLSRFTTNDSRSARFDDLQPNSNFTIHLSAMTRTRRRGEEQVANCSTPPALPDVPPRPRWRKIMENNRYMFKMFLPRMSERNGPICCYRVHMVRILPNLEWKDLPPPQDISIIDYEEAHHPNDPLLGAYITDIFSNDKFPPDSELVLGDRNTRYNESNLKESDPTLTRSACRRCVQRPRRPPDLPPAALATAPPAQPTTTEEVDEEVTGMPADEGRRRRSLVNMLLGPDEELMEAEDLEDEQEVPARFRRSLENSNFDQIMKNPEEKLRVIDDFLDSNSNYTMFVELIPEEGESPHILPPQYSDYVNTLMPAASPVVPLPSTALELTLQVTCAVAAVVLLAMIIFCVMQTRRSRKLPPHATVEMNPIQQAFRYVVGHIGGRQQLISSAPPDMPPIAKEDLAAAYAERQVDSDYGFQKEFEMLPDCFPDRTTHASEARENQPKNRYPDIKAYDQTRVKLSQIDSIAGSDYINANYVMGYRERKQFICAQGPTDTTVNDFWRMIWEHGLELIVMLTNLEEYSKVKCSKYWPDEVRGARAFGPVTVHHVAEKRYSDYIVRELRITKQPTNSEGQPIVENNGVAKRNGDCKEPSDSSAPTSPREVKETEGRIVRQYHFLMWKDFAAPEHPHSILKFIKRVNEAWAGMVGRPVVVHCSAGVGRTGTLVALDCLLEQLRATGHASVFNTVAELRRQRNFLVQSLKQYVFVYRALVEWAHYGDTEIPASRLKAAVDRLRSTPDGQDKSLMEREFEKMMSSPVAEPVKSCAAGAGEEVRNRNRSVDCLPYDRNRVILTPLPGRDFSTYINASFIEAYDNSEGFIITQDPLPNTIMDFWRMVSEHNVSTIVMLSEIGEGKCPRYWDDGTAQYEHISVQYEESESCPYYTRRQFRVTNNKNGETCSVRQLQYQGWPTAPGHVPEVTRGLADLADAARAHRPPEHAMLVHCHLGTERSALFVALCTLICQLRVERRADVNVVARKVRSQRARTIDTILQYEFLHRAILNYAELHNLLEDS